MQVYNNIRAFALSRCKNRNPDNPIKERRKRDGYNIMWILTASLSAVFAGVTSVLVKCGVKNTDSDVATAIRTFVVLIFSIIMVLIVGSFGSIASITAKEATFLVISGLCTGISWLCYFRALALGNVNKVAPVDKSSVVLSVIFAIILFHETNALLIKLVCITAIFAGTLLMIEKKRSHSENELPDDSSYDKQSKKWLICAALSAIFAAFTSIFAKIGIANVESNLGTAIRTFVVLIFAWAIILGKNKMPLVKTVNKKELGFILLSGVTTGASWLCYYSAIQTGIVSVVVPIDKLSILITVVFSAIFLKERLTPKAVVGLVLIIAGTVCMAVFA